jgi:hypothetical protein
MERKVLQLDAHAELAAGFFLRQVDQIAMNAVAVD